MSRVVMVISPLGFGHLSRQIALKNAMSELDPDVQITMVISDEQDKFFRRAIFTSEHINIEHLPLTPKITMSNWMEVDIESTRESFLRFWEWESQIRDDTEWGRILQGADLVINDIESLHNPIVKKMGIPIVGVSNFVWSDILRGLGLDEIADNYETWERLADFNFQLPFSTKCLSMRNPEKVGLLARKPDMSRVASIRSQTSKPIVFMGYSRKKWEIDLMDFVSKLDEEGFKVIIHERFYNAELNEDLDPILIKSDDPNTQDYFAAADVVVSKIGFGVLSEILVGATPILFWKRAQYIEDEILGNYVEDQGIGSAIDHDITPSNLVEKIKELLTVSFSPSQPQNLQIASKILALLNRENK